MAEQRSDLPSRVAVIDCKRSGDAPAFWVVRFANGTTPALGRQPREILFHGHPKPLQVVPGFCLGMPLGLRFSPCPLSLGVTTPLHLLAARLAIGVPPTYGLEYFAANLARFWLYLPFCPRFCATKHMKSPCNFDKASYNLAAPYSIQTSLTGGCCSASDGSLIRS